MREHQWLLDMSIILGVIGFVMLGGFMAKLIMLRAFYETVLMTRRGPRCAICGFPEQSCNTLRLDNPDTWHYYVDGWLVRRPRVPVLIPATRQRRLRDRDGRYYHPERL